MSLLPIAKKNVVLSNITFEAINADSSQLGHVTAIMGNSGTGKSTIIKLLIDNDLKYTGEIITNPKVPIISYVPQDDVFFEHLTPLQNARYFENKSNYKSNFNSDLFNSLLETLGLTEVLKSKSVIELSGGQRKRIMLLRALSIKPDFLLLDEPCTGLDAEVKMQFLFKLRQLVKDYDLFVLYITHHQDEAKIIADDVIYLSKDPLSNAVNRISKDTITNFIGHTPTIESAKVFHFPDLNVFKFSRDNNILKFTNQKSDNFISLKSDFIEFNDEDGFEYEVISKSTIYSQIKLKESGTILITQTNKIKGLKYCTLNGQGNEYNNEGQFISQIQITHNKIIS